MMKRLFILFTIFLSYASTTLQAQDNLPQNFSISLGGGVTLPRVEGNRNDFFSKNGDRAGYNLMTEGRYYFMPNFALGLQYDYLRVARLPDKMHLHYIHPNITYRYLWSEGNQGAFLSFGIGYMNYQERTYQRSERNGISFQRGYCGLSFGMVTSSTLPRNYQECFVQIYSQPTGLQTPTHGFPIHTIMMTE